MKKGRVKISTLNEVEHLFEWNNKSWKNSQRFIFIVL